MKRKYISGFMVMALVGLLLAACGENTVPASQPTTAVQITTQTATTQTVATTSAATTQSSASTSTVAQSAAPISTAKAETSATRLLVRDGTGTMSDQLVQLKLPEGTIERKFPLGVASTDWKTLYSATSSGEKTTVLATDLTTGAGIARLVLDGKYSLPPIDSGTRLGGLSYDGKTLVLVEGTGDIPAQKSKDERKVSRFAVLDTSLQTPPRILELPGNFSYDTISAEGKGIFLIEALTPYEAGKYRVRVYDTYLNTLQKEAVVEKGDPPDAVMQGYGGAQVTGNGGEWVFTLYRDSDHGPFVHALNTNLRTAACLDLPTTGKENEAAQMNWTLALNNREGKLYAVNLILGQVVEIHADGWPEIQRKSSITPTTQPQARTVPAGWATSAVSADDKKLFVVNSTGLTVIDTSSLKVSGQITTKWAFSSIAVEPEGNQLFVSNLDTGKVLRLDATSGKIMTELDGKVRPWVLLKIGS